MCQHARKIFQLFFPDSHIISIDTFGNGHINETFLVVTDIGKFILQGVNSNVFNIENLVSNFEQLIEHSRKTNTSGKFFPILFPTTSGEHHFIDSTAIAWRTCEFLEHTLTYSISPSVDISRLAGSTMGKFQQFLNQIDHRLFKDTITNFHNPSKRFTDFELALSGADSLVVKYAKKEIDFALQHSSITVAVAEILRSNSLPKRITHNDTKLENMLFSNDLSKGYAIDLDTVMPGCIMFDFGDMVRSITPLSAEDEKDISLVNFNLNHFEELSKGYFSELGESMTIPEKDSIFPGLLSIIYVQGIRFLADFLQGNTYYKTDYPDHNLIRCRTQFKLLSDIISNKSQISHILNKVLG